MTRNEAVAHILGSGGRFVSFCFVRRTTTPNGQAGDLRQMTARLGVRKHLRGGPRAYDPTPKNLLFVWEPPCETADPPRAGGYKAVPIDSLTRVMVDGRWVEVND